MCQLQDAAIPDGIAWLVKHHPELSDAQIGKLIGTTKETIKKNQRAHTLEHPKYPSKAPCYARSMFSD